MVDIRWAMSRVVFPCLLYTSVLGQVSYGTPMGRENREFYKEIPLRPMPYGQALAILFLVEWKKRCV